MPPKVVWCTCTPCRKSGNSRDGVVGCLIPAHSKQAHLESERLLTLFGRVVGGNNKGMHAEPSITAPVSDVAQQIGSAPQVTDRQSIFIQSSSLRVMTKMAQIIESKSSAFRSQDYQIVFRPSVRTPVTFSDLLTTGDNNRAFFIYYDWIRDQIELLNNLKFKTDFDDEERQIQSEINGRLGLEKSMLDNMISSAWQITGTGKNVYRTVRIPYTTHVQLGSSATKPEGGIAELIMFVAVLLETIGGLAHRELCLILGVFRMLLVSTFMYANGGNALSADQQHIVDRVPNDIRTVHKRIHLDPEYIIFASCPACHSLYPRDTAPGNCSFVELLATCNEPLFKDIVGPPSSPQPRKRKRTALGNEEMALAIRMPHRTYQHQKFAAWLARFLSRSDIEICINGSWNSRPNPDGVVADIFESEAIKTFRYRDGAPFGRQIPNEYRLVFGLSVDWFNPRGNKQAGKKHSTGSIYMVCLNLPPALRYKTENVYLAGLIPGPSEPFLHRVNAYLAPLVDDLEECWTPGIYLERTPLKIFGALVRCALIPLICDILAARKVAGLTAHSSTIFCAFCSLVIQQKNDIAWEAWPKKHDYSLHLSEAKKWRDAQTEGERKSIEQKYGIKWSELLRLPYWNPLRYTVIDPMHNIFLGLYKHHCREIWNMNIDDMKEPRQVGVHDIARQMEEYSRGIGFIKRGSAAGLKGLRADYLHSLASANNVAISIPAEGRKKATKQIVADSLVEWYKAGPGRKIVVPAPRDPDTMDTTEYTTDVMDQDVIRNIRRDINLIMLPSWVETPPRDFGSKSHGKLKADTWRTAATIHLAISLITQWGHMATSSWQFQLLENFMCLTMAGELATRRRMDPSIVQEYKRYILLYLAGIRALHDQHNLMPNHHYSVHLADHLKFFGPAHGWWSFPFERYNGVIARIKKNNKINEMESTMMSTFCRASNLRATISSISPESSGPFTEVVKQLKNYTLSDELSLSNFADDFAPQMVSAATPNYFNHKERDLPDEIYLPFLTRLNNIPSILYDPQNPSRAHSISRAVNYVPKIRIRGVLYKDNRSQKGIGNSFVIYRLPGENVLRAGQICDIFMRRGADTSASQVQSFLVIREFLPLTAEDKTGDPFLRYSPLRMRLHYHQQNDAPHVVQPDDIIGHFASFVYTPATIGKKCIVVRELYRVRAGSNIYFRSNY